MEGTKKRKLYHDSEGLYSPLSQSSQNSIVETTPKQRSITRYLCPNPNDQQSDRQPQTLCTPPLRNGYVMGLPRVCRTIQEVMCNVVVYVEVMTIDEDRSDKIKMIAAAMGAQVNDRLYKNTTHVIFREGSMTTYKKAMKWGIPLVSVTWLEECRKTLTLADPSTFPPINLEPYEKPELYRRVRKANPTSGEVSTTPERFALKPTKPLDDLDRRLLEYYQNKNKEMTDNSSSLISNSGQKTLLFSPIAESTKIGQKTPNQSNVTPLLRRLMLRNAEEDKREREQYLNELLGQPYNGTINEEKSMEITPNFAPPINNEAKKDVVDLTLEVSPPDRDDTTTPKLIKRRQTMCYSNVNMDISPLLKENVPDEVKVADRRKSVYNLTLEAIDGNVENTIKVPKMLEGQRKSSEHETLKEDILKRKEVLLEKSVVIEKTNKRRSLLPLSLPEKEITQPKVNNRRTLFSIPSAVDEESTKSRSVTKRRTLMPSMTKELDTKKPKLAMPVTSKSTTIIPVEKKVVKPIIKAPPLIPDLSNKRKLFSSNVDSMMPPVGSPSVKKFCNGDKLKLISQPLTPTTIKDFQNRINNKKPPTANRRSTMDFQKPFSIPKSSSSSRESEFSFNRGSNSKNVIVLTNANQHQIDFVKELVSKLGHNFEYDTRVGKRTTHLVTVVRKRNMNLLRGIIRGAWVLDFDWLVKSSEAGKFLPEQRFEIPEYAKTVRKVRSERQAFGLDYKMDLYSGISGHFYVFEEIALPVHHVKELINLCGGTVVSDIAEAKYIIGDKPVENVTVISPSWIFESICQYQFLNHRKYLKH